MKIEVLRFHMAPITKRNSNGVVGTPVHTCITPDGVRHSGNGCIYDAARHMIAKGTDPKTPLRVYKDKQKILSGSLDAFARLAWKGGNADPFSRLWRPNPLAGPMPPALAAWFAAAHG